MNARMKVINQSRVALMKTFYNFVVLLSMQQHNISESVSLILVPKSGKFQTCAESNNTHHRLAISSDIAYSVWSIVYSSAHGFFQSLGTDERTGSTLSRFYNTYSTEESY